MKLRSEQDPISVTQIINLLHSVSGKVYVEIGCAQLGTLDKFRSALPQDGLAIGVDCRRYDNWNWYMNNIKNQSGCKNVYLSHMGNNHLVVLQWLKEILDGKKVDFLFIDGDHSVESTQRDWQDFSPFVRSGGIVAFHDLDWGAFNRGQRDGQGAAAVLSQLRMSGYTIGTVPGKVGIGFIKRK
jgi:hypothetical protein